MPATTPAAMPASSITMRGDAARERGGRPDRKIEAAADDDEGHPHGDHRHDRGLHQDVGEVERRRKRGVSSAVAAHKHDKRDERHLPGELPPQWIDIAQVVFTPPIAARNFGSSRPSARSSARDDAAAWNRKNGVAKAAELAEVAGLRSGRRRRARRNRGSAHGPAPWRATSMPCVGSSSSST